MNSDVKAASQNIEKPRRKRLSFRAVSSLVFGLAAFGLGPLTAIPAVYTGYDALQDIKQNSESMWGKGFAYFGIVLGWTITVLFALVIVIVIFSPGIAKLTGGSN